MEKKIIITLLVLFTTSLLATDQASKEKKVKEKYNKIVNDFKSNKVEVIVEGIVTSVEVIKERIIPTKPLEGKNIEVISKITFKVLKNYKKSVGKEIFVYIKGELYYKNGVLVFHKVSNEAHPLLETNDHILMGLRKYRDGYAHVFEKNLQIPFNEDLINNIQEQKKEHKLRKLYSRNRSYTSINENIISKKNTYIATENKSIIKLLKKELKNQFKEVEVINE